MYFDELPQFDLKLKDFSKREKLSWAQVINKSFSFIPRTLSPSVFARKKQKNKFYIFLCHVIFEKLCNIEIVRKNVNCDWLRKIDAFLLTILNKSNNYFLSCTSCHCCQTSNIDLQCRLHCIHYKTSQNDHNIFMRE